MIVLLTSMKDADKYLEGNPDGLKDAHVTCAFPVPVVVFFWFLKHTAGLKVDCSAESVEIARKFRNRPEVWISHGNCSAAMNGEIGLGALLH